MSKTTNCVQGEGSAQLPGLAEVQHAWQAMSPTVSAESLAERVMASGQQRRRTWWPTLLGVGGVGLAAGLATFWLSPEQVEPEGPPAPSAAVPVQAVPVVEEIEVPEGKNAVVMTSSNPDIAVVIFY